MRIQPTPTNGRIITGDTPWGRFDIAVDAAPAIDPGVRRLRIVNEDGVQVGTMTIEIRTPAGAALVDAGDCSPCAKKRAAAATKQDLTNWNRAIADGTTTP